MVAKALPPLEDRLEAVARAHGFAAFGIARADAAPETAARLDAWLAEGCHGEMIWMESRSEEHTSELQSLMRISYAVFCLKKTNKKTNAKLTTRAKTAHTQKYTN